MATDKIVIIGGGLAGAKAAEALRARGFGGQVTIVGEEAHLPYERPPLSKGYLTGKSGLDSAFPHDADWYAKHEVDLRLGVAATAIDRAGHQVILADGTGLGYGKLLLATGASPRRLPGADGVRYLRTIEDSDQIRDVLATGTRLVVIGAGWIGLEVAAAARLAGLEVTVLESLELPLLRVLGPEMARVFADLHTAHGVDLRLGVAVEQVRADGAVLADGTRVDADAVVAGIGAAPNAALAERAGLEVSDGIVTSAALATSDPDVFAAGDVARAYHPLLRRHLRVEHWANALKQPATAAAAMLGERASYEDLPYFYTDQYDLGMEYVGYAEPGGYDRVVVRGTPAPDGEFIAFWLSGGRVVAGMNVNVWDVTDAVKALIRSGRPVDADALADTGTPLEEAGGATGR
jgi:3-phenylpropionate/trans-cinnamate dioxygenase ferredoxin reductase subunit